MLAKQYQIYLFAGIYPFEDQYLNKAPVYESFNKEKLAMLFGGNLDYQKIVMVPMGKGSKDKPSSYNRCFMSYRNRLYPVFMPCGEFKEREIPEDDKPLFKDA